MIFCAGVTDGSWLPSEGVVCHFMLRQADIWHQNTIPCRLCLSDTVETEFRFVMLCPALDHLRSTFFSSLSDLDTSFISLYIGKFQCILSANGIICTHF